MSTATRVDRLYGVRGTLRIMASPILWTAKTYLFGARNLMHGTRRLLGREPRFVQKAVRPARNYDAGALDRARALFPRAFVHQMKVIGFDDSDVFLAHLRTLPVAIAGGHSFAAIWDNVCDDKRLTESEVEALSREAVEMLGRDMEMEGLLHVSSDSPTTPEAGAESPAPEPRREYAAFSEAGQ